MDGPRREDPFEGKSPEIDYPCTWGFRVMGESEGDLRAAVAVVMGRLEHEVDFGNRTAQGSYCSLHVRLVVHDEQHRNDIFTALTAHPAVRFVL
jgi:putative lipoic acid-binding regulatory protein